MNTLSMRRGVPLLILALPLYALAACSGNVAIPTSQPPAVATTMPTLQPATVAPAATQAQPQASATSLPPTAPVAAATNAAPTNAPTQAPSNSSAGIPVGNIEDVLKKACDALRAQPNARAEMTIAGTGADKQIQGSALIEVQGTERARLKSVSDGTTSEIVVVAPNFYIYQDGTWKKQPATSALASQQVNGIHEVMGGFLCVFNAPGQLAAQLPLHAQVTGVESQMALPEIVNGVPTLVYQVNVTVTAGDEPGAGSAKLWLGATDSVPQKMTMQFSNAKSSGQVTIDYSYADINIQPPIQ